MARKPGEVFVQVCFYSPNFWPLSYAHIIRCGIEG